MDNETLGAAIAITGKTSRTAQEASETAQAAKAAAEAAADRAVSLSQGVYMGKDGKFYVDIE